MNSQQYNLTNPQKAIWLTEQFHKNTSIGNICGTLEIKEKIEIFALQKAICNFIKRNDSIRTHLTMVDDSICQSVVDDSSVTIPVISLKNTDALNDLEQNIIQKPFDLLDHNLYNFTIFQFPNGTGGFVANLHHIICDAWTMSLLINQIMDYYSYSIHPRENSLPEETFSYFNFVDSERTYLASNKFKKSKLFWEDQFKDLSFSYLNENHSNSYAAERKSYTLTKEQCDQITSFCTENKVSFYSLFMSVLSIYLSKINNSPSAIVGTPVLNRCNFKEKNTTGMFISTVPFKTNVDRNSQFTDFLKDVSQNEFSIFRHQKYPYNLLLDSLRQKYDFSNNLFDVCVSYQNARDNKENSTVDYSCRWLFNHCVSNNLDIHIYDMDDTGLFHLYYDYKKDIFTNSEIELLHQRFFFMLKQIFQNPTILIQDIEIVTPTEKQFLLQEYNHTDISLPIDIPIYQLFEKQAKQTPNKIAIADLDYKLSYQQLLSKVTHLATLLIEDGVQHQDIVTLFFDDSIDLIVSILAVLKIGACYIPIDTHYPKERIEYIIQNSQVKKILTNSIHSKQLDFENDLLFLVDFITLDSENNYSLDIIGTSSEDLAYIIYTSGSTGKPKGVKIANKSLVNYISWAIGQYVNEDETNFPLYSSVAFDLTVTSIFTPLLSGNTIYIYQNENPQLLLKQIIEEKKVQIIKLTPAHLSLLQDLNLSKSVITKLIVGGDILTKEVCEKITSLFPHPIHVYNEYGPTEATVGCMIYEYRSEDIYSSVPIGIPIANTKIYLLNNDLELLPFGQIGEMYIGGDCLSLGYTDIENTNKKYLPNPFSKNEKIYKTGDLAKLHDNGIMEYFGRIDFQVKLNGYRIEMGEIQSKLLAHPNIKDAYISILDISDHKMICAYYVSKDEILDLDSYLNQFLPNYMIPSCFIKLDSIPLTANGKVDKAHLPLPKKEEKIYVEPQNTLEFTLQDVFSRLLNVNEKLSVTDNLFDYYIDSLLLIKAQSILYTKGINVNTQNFYDYKSIRSLSNYLLDTHESLSELSISFPNIKEITKSISLPHDFHHILLFGATGFLGIHILYYLLMNTSCNIFCLIREKDDINAFQRLQHKLQFYFPSLDWKNYQNRIEVITGNILNENFGVSSDLYQRFGNMIDCVIDVAAIVKHYGDYELFDKTNVSGTERIINFCTKFNIPFHYVSTLTISGNGLVRTPNSDFCETDFYIGQDYKDNVYVRSKFEAEKLILNACKEDHLIASIYRVGNITNRFSDGTFQENSNENAFLNRLTAFVNLAIIPEELVDLPFEFTPVDYCAKFIVRLLREQNQNIKIYHLYNQNFLSCRDIIQIFKQFGIIIQIVSLDKFKEVLSNSSHTYFGIIGYIKNITHENTTHITLHNEITNLILKDLALSWPVLDALYLAKILTYLKNNNFIGGDSK